MLLEKNLTFLKISANLYYYRATDGSYPLAIELSEKLDEFGFIISKFATVLSSEEMNKITKLDSDKIADSIVDKSNSFG